jgi:pimeloyl-ACP methyl ester carboxylesterase
MATARSVELAGLSFRVLAPDSEAAALLVHGLASDADACAARAGQLGAIVYDRRGYGGSSAPETYGATTVEEQSEDAARLLDALGAGPLRIVGDGFGALIALDLARRHPAKVAALALTDPIAPQFLADGTTWLREIHEDLATALRDGGPQRAVAAWLGERADPETLARAQRAHVAFFADIAALPTWQVSRRELAAITVPTSITAGPEAAPHVSAAAAALTELLPGAR